MSAFAPCSLKYLLMILRTLKILIYSLSLSIYYQLYFQSIIVLIYTQISHTFLCCFHYFCYWYFKAFCDFYCHCCFRKFLTRYCYLCKIQGISTIFICIILNKVTDFSSSLKTAGAFILKLKPKWKSLPTNLKVTFSKRFLSPIF